MLTRLLALSLMAVFLLQAGCAGTRAGSDRSSKSASIAPPSR